MLIRCELQQAFRFKGRFRERSVQGLYPVTMPSIYFSKNLVPKLDLAFVRTLVADEITGDEYHRAVLVFETCRPAKLRLLSSVNGDVNPTPIGAYDLCHEW